MAGKQHPNSARLPRYKSAQANAKKIQAQVRRAQKVAHKTAGGAGRTRQRSKGSTTQRGARGKTVVFVPG